MRTLLSVISPDPMKELRVAFLKTKKYLVFCLVLGGFDTIRPKSFFTWITLRRELVISYSLKLSTCVNCTNDTGDTSVT